MPDMARLIGGFLFGGIGFVAFVYGKGQASLKLMVLGAVLMAYPYFVPNTLATYVIGVLLTAGVFLFRDV